MSYKAVFLDRDGTVNEEVSYLPTMGMLKLIPGSAEAMRLLRSAGFKLVIITNQSGIARGYFTERNVKRIHQKLKKMLKREGVFYDGIFYSPYSTGGKVKPFNRDSPLRKPGIGMLEKGRDMFGIDLTKSYMVGDRESDIGAGKNGGCKSILVKTGYGEQVLAKGFEKYEPDFVASNLLAAAKWIIEDSQKSQG